MSEDIEAVLFDPNVFPFAEALTDEEDESTSKSRERYEELVSVCSSRSAVSSQSDANALLKKTIACLLSLSGFADAELCSIHVMAEMTGLLLEEKCSEISIYLRGASTVSNGTLRLLCERFKLEQIEDLERCISIECNVGIQSERKHEKRSKVRKRSDDKTEGKRRKKKKGRPQ
uniref:Uncharacterized protein n=1 Tax=Trichuris muris TaxID=70415 RepID=A0A5S6R5X9_TRIMR